MIKPSDNLSPTKAVKNDEVVLCISKARLRQLMQTGQLVASDFKCANNCTKCVVRQLLLECASIDLAAND
ncbi:hypothetical protein ACR0ST_04690 [Aliidiomarina sp. Khilg15.8]